MNEWSTTVLTEKALVLPVLLVMGTVTQVKGNLLISVNGNLFPDLNEYCNLKGLILPLYTQCNGTTKNNNEVLKGTVTQNKFSLKSGPKGCKDL